MSEELCNLARAWQKFDLSLRENEGFNSGAFQALKEALYACTDAWAESDQIPRLGASILVDIVPATESNCHLYPEPVKTQITDAIYELQELIVNCVAPTGECHDEAGTGERDDGSPDGVES
jgi:hypothetical protein